MLLCKDCDWLEGSRCARDTLPISPVTGERMVTPALSQRLELYDKYVFANDACGREATYFKPKIAKLVAVLAQEI